MKLIVKEAGPEQNSNTKWQEQNRIQKKGWARMELIGKEARRNLN